MAAAVAAVSPAAPGEVPPPTSCLGTAVRQCWKIFRLFVQFGILENQMYMMAYNAIHLSHHNMKREELTFSLRPGDGARYAEIK